MVPASGALRGAGVSPLQRGVARAEEERWGAQEGRGHLQATEGVGGVPGEAERSDPAVHCLLRGTKREVQYSYSSVVMQALWPSLSDWSLSTAASTLHQRALRVCSPGGLT